MKNDFLAGANTFTSKKIPVRLRNLTTFHIMVHGRTEDWIAKTRDEAKAYMTDLFDASQKRNTHIIHYAVMDNHIHIVLNGKSLRDITETVHSANMSASLRGRRCGRFTRSPFDRRILYSPVEDTNALLTIMRYITNNALQQDHVCRLNGTDEYRFSQYNYVDRKTAEKLTGLSLLDITRCLLENNDEFFYFTRKNYRKSVTNRRLFILDDNNGQN